jgi:uncharacterized Tic20 family protein
MEEHHMAEAATAPDANARSWASVCHLSGLLLFGAPFGNVLGPLIVYLIKKDDDPYIALAGRESLNFQIFIAICGFFLFVAYIASFFLTFASVFYESTSKAHSPMFPFPFPLIIAPFFLILAIFDLVSVIVAAVRANKGIAYRYPITLRFVH